MKTGPGSDIETQTIFSHSEDPFADKRVECHLDLPLIASLSCFCLPVSLIVQQI
jgi:hypothetical protein